MFKNRLLILLAGSALCLCCQQGYVYAQSVPVTGSADIGQLTKQQPLSPKLNESLPPDAKNAAISRDDIIINGADKVTFHFNKLILEGMEAYPSGHFDYLTIQLTNRTISLQDVLNVINTISRIYKQDGYILSSFNLPEQDITSGNVVLKIAEGRILQVHKDNFDTQNPSLLTAYLNKIQSIYPFNINEFEHALLLMNSLPGAKFKSVLRRPQESHITEGIDIVLLKESTPTEWNVGINNYGSQYAGPWKVNLDKNFIGTFNPYDLIELQLSAAYPLKEIKFASATYTIPIYTLPGLSFKTGINWGGTSSGSNLKQYELDGLSREVNFSLSYNNLLTRQTNWITEFGFRAKDIRSKILGAEFYDDRLRIIRANTTWQQINKLHGVALVNGEISHGLNGFGARESGSTNLSRSDGRSDFTKATVQATYLQSLPFRFQGLVRTSAQYSFTPVLSSEEFGFGGFPGGRGLDPSEITGDHGASVVIELQYAYPTLSPDMQLTPYAFLDIGKVWQKGDSPSNPVSAVTTGVGTKVILRQRTSIDFTMSIPLTHSAENPEKYGNSESPRYLLSINQSF